MDMWNKLFKSKSKQSHKKSSKLSVVVKNLTCKRVPKDREDVDNKTKLEFLVGLAYLPEQDVLDGDLHSCPICNRKFRSDVYQKHVAICERMATKKRKTFDSSRQRREGTDMALYLPKNFGLPEHKEIKSPTIVKEPTPPAKVRTDPAKEPTPFKRDPIRQSKRTAPPVSEQCPHCERCFGVKAFDRHVEWCEKKARLNIHSTPKSVHAAKEKLEARTKYKPPSLKNKRDLNREKYSDLSCGTSMNSILSDSFSIGKRSKSNSIERERKSSVASMTSSITSDSQDDTARAIFDDQFANLSGDTSKEEDHMSEMYLDLDFDRNEYENKLLEHESILDRKDRKTRLEASKYLLQETKSSFKMKSQFQISKKQFFAKLAKNRPPITASRISTNSNSDVDRSKSSASPNFAYGSIRTCASTSSLGSEKIIGERKFDLPKKANLSTNSTMNNTELVVESYGFRNKPSYDPVTVENKAIDETPLNESMSRDDKNSAKSEDIVEAGQKSSWPMLDLNKFNMMSKAASLNSYYFKDSDLQLEQANESLEDKCLEDFEKNERQSLSANVSRKSSLKSIGNSEKASLVEIYTPRSIKCYNVSHENSNGEQEDADMLLEMKFPSKLTNNNARLPISLTCDDRIKNPVTRTVLNSFNMLQSKYANGYDPFMSAKRQLEELFSSTNPNSSSTSTSNKSNTMSTSLNLKSPLNTTNSINPIKSNFRRTSSLRVPKKTPKPLLYIPTYKPTTTIQRGISDEGPISSNFLKPEEYDELPVKGHANQSPPDIIPRPVSRSSSRSRESSPVVVVKRDQNSNVNRRNLKLEILKPNTPSSDYPLSKTDSLAVFLKYENDLSCSPGSSEKELKDKSNSLNKQTALKNSFAELLESKIDRGSVSPPPPPLPQPEQVLASKKYSSIKLEPLNHTFVERTQNQPIAKHSQNADLENNFIDPDLINDCDNLSVSRMMNLPKTKSLSDVTDTIVNTKSSDNVNSNKVLSQRNSCEKRTLKRSLKLNKENFLYDTSPVSGKDPTSPFASRDFPPQKANEMISSPPLRTSESFNKLRNNDCIDALFDDFDFDEFISSFEDDEQYPIFKGYKELMSNRSLNKLNKSDSSSASSTTSVEKSEHNSEEMSSPNVCDKSDALIPLNKTNSHPKFEYPNMSMIQRNDSKTAFEMVGSETQMTHRENFNDAVSKAERDLLQSVQELDAMCESNTPKMVDSDENSSSDRVRRTLESKLGGGDSAYSSLSRHSQFEHVGREQPYRQRQQVFQIPDIVTSKRSPYQTTSIDSTVKRQPSHSLSSSGSDSSLPPIVSRKPHEISHSNNGYKETSKRIDESHSNNGHNKEMNARLSKFCHSCGSRFTLEQAKFCMECGVKRLLLE